MNSSTPVGESRCSPGLTFGTNLLCCVSTYKISPARVGKRCLRWLIVDVPSLPSASYGQYVSEAVGERGL